MIQASSLHLDEYEERLNHSISRKCNDNEANITHS